MPVVPAIHTRRPSQDEFAHQAYEVMQHVFAIHDEFGRFFDERVYKRALAERMHDALFEVPVDVTHRSFTKRYYADAVVRNCGLFEFKAVEAIHPKHRSQGIHYLLLFDLPHGKIINVRTEQVEHEFINCGQQLCDLRCPIVRESKWDSSICRADDFRELLTSLLSDWGTGLELSLYEEALTHFLGGKDSVEVTVPVLSGSWHLADQPMRLVAPGVAFKLTTLPQREETFVEHARKLLHHTPLQAVLWANITNQHVTFSTLR